MGISGHFPLPADWCVARPLFRSGARVVFPEGVFPGAKSTLRLVCGPYAVLRVGSHADEPIRYFLVEAARIQGARFIPKQIRCVVPEGLRRPIQALLVECERLATETQRRLYAGERRQLRDLLTVCGPESVLTGVGELLLSEGHVPKARAAELRNVLRGNK
jgi:hypothetical protein